MTAEKYTRVPLKNGVWTLNGGVWTLVGTSPSPVWKWRLMPGGRCREVVCRDAQRCMVLGRYRLDESGRSSFFFKLLPVICRRNSVLRRQRLRLCFERQFLAAGWEVMTVCRMITTAKTACLWRTSAEHYTPGQSTVFFELNNEKWEQIDASSWPKFNGSADRACSLLVDGGTVYAGTARNGVYAIGNDAKWFPVGAGWPSDVGTQYGAWSLAVHNGTLYAGTYDWDTSYNGQRRRVVAGGRHPGRMSER